jgi:hypothetical protein
MKPIATDTADFPSLRKRGCIYVDKTMYMHRLIDSNEAKLFFVSRPRRFGKSLTVSALKAIFQGRRDLFEGLAIDKPMHIHSLIHINALSFSQRRKIRSICRYRFHLLNIITNTRLRRKGKTLLTCNRLVECAG